MYNQISLWDDLADTNNMKLENQVNKKTIISTDGEVILYQNFFNTQESSQLFEDLSSKVKWKQEIIQIFGKKMPIPRLTAWYGDEGKSYTYSGIEQHPEPWNTTLQFIKSKVEEIAKVSFNSVLLNLYRHGKDSVSWHSDDEPELGKNPIIASVSFGATRRFSLRHKHYKNHKIAIDLTSGSLLLMQGETQHFWQHQIAKTAKEIQPRINLTFRVTH
ncbi:alpha-ketoglutarate-dependent dioxygenase AlkB [Dolichospermum circinale CS-534/05]|uniref:alpha-ketoglutarate-dependent dioxygenase AlkB family protein n=1 Tax=Dolichospermum circinale TaxID=109265 RepID=UPI00232D1BD0|nr:alpha-ketoglutarate-dependent dioxygenase AlkB [Dolichospermum circinale]MDB9456472.1 alpha-ketoglutarate-dependent dioxygenase AlkB [Dolichospermum circinale CS-541/06]MDB9464322.1 alpha-ketoglutarate-dependent dioxygenase AlkB [Dolichospermum circinale CS-541/04]MDB9491575.1 alpha-ketoglutarate-dependent dioxygenase AlkB [Dolichospermum circinale CS-534/05]MDB9547662.1 alpha-ketoglutarate-dependent dioxygenase AlkB [Dolichospermum circinale CS-1031]